MQGAVTQVEDISGKAEHTLEVPIMAMTSSSTADPAPIAGHDNQPATVTLLLSSSNHAPTASNALEASLALTSERAPEVCESKITAQSTVQRAPQGQRRPNNTERTEEPEQQPLPEKRNIPVLCLPTPPASDSRMMHWSHGVSLDLSMNLCSVPQTPMSPSIYTFPQPCSPRAPTATQRLSSSWNHRILESQNWNHGRLSPPSHAPLQKNEDTQSPVSPSMQSLPPFQPDATPDEAHKSAGEREKERETYCQMDKR